MPPDAIYDPQTGMYFSPSTGQYFDMSGNPMSGSAGATVPNDVPPGATAGNPPAAPPQGGSPGGKWILNPNTYNYDWVDPKGQLATIGGHSVLFDPSTGAIIKDFGPVATGAGSSNSGFYSAGLQAQSAAAELAERQRQFNEKFGYDKAVNDQQYGLRAGDLSGYMNGAPTLARDQLNQNQSQFQSKQALDYFTQLSNEAANPRNYIESFFKQRGELAPAAAQGQGNVAAIQRYLPFLLGSQSTATSGAPSASMARGTNQTIGAQGPAVANFVPPWALGTPANTSPNPNPITASAPMTRVGASDLGSPTTTDMPGGAPGQVFRGVGNQGPAFGIAFNEHADAPITGTPGAMNQPANVGGGYTADDATKEAYVKSVGGQYARGGIIPEPVVGRGTMSGKTYTFGEPDPRTGRPRPEGVVPANILPKFLKRRAGAMVAPGQPIHSYALGGIIGDPYTTPDPYDAPPPAPPSPDPYSGGSSTPDPGYTTGPYAGPGGYQPDPSVVAPFTGGSLPSSPTGMQGTGTGVATPGGYYGPTTPTPTPTTTPSSPAPDALATPGPAPLAGPAPTGAVTPQVDPTSLLPPFVTQPQGLPQASNNWNSSLAQKPWQTDATMPGGTPGPVYGPGAGFGSQTGGLTGGIFPRDVTPPGTFGHVTPGLTPQFLPGEDTNNSVLSQLQQSGAVPPFLTRLFGQARGDQTFGTNTPQRMDLPKDVPLVSSLQYSLMTPSEQQALLSFVSAYGVSPDDYLALIKQYSPTGGASSQPTFGNQFQPVRQ